MSPHPEQPLMQTAVVYDSYDITHPPKHPGIGWTHFACVSDTHSLIFPVPPEDILLHAGDLSTRGTLKDIWITLNWLKTLPHPAKYFIAGNHDLALDANYEPGGDLRHYKPSDLSVKDLSEARALVHSRWMHKAGMFYLEHEAAVYTATSGKKYTIYGSLAAPFYSLGAFQYQAGEGKAIYDCILPSTDILMTRTPPHGVCDVTKRGAHAGCRDLAKRLAYEDLRNCRLHVYGHIHEARGAVLVGRTEQSSSGRVSVNAAMPHVPLPIIINLED